MGRPGACVTCENPRRAAIEAARAEGQSFVDLARRFGLAEASVRRHFKHRHALAPTPPKPEPLIMVLFREDLEKNAAATGVPFADLVFHRLHCERKDIAARTAAEADELVDLMETFATAQEFEEMFGEAADRGAIYVPR